VFVSLFACSGASIVSTVCAQGHEVSHEPMELCAQMMCVCNGVHLSRDELFRHATLESMEIPSTPLDAAVRVLTGCVCWCVCPPMRV
jgi:hypothetical protein